MNVYLNLWTFLEPVITILGLVVSLYLYFKDPVRRWSFLGYRPTILLFLFDPKTSRILLVQHKADKKWGVSQAGIYDSHIKQNVNNLLEEELQINKLHTKLAYVKPMYTVPLKNRRNLRNTTIGSVSIAQKLKGKGYIACFVYADLEKINKDINYDISINQHMIVSVKEARKLIKGS